MPCNPKSYRVLRTFFYGSSAKPFILSASNTIAHALFELSGLGKGGPPTRLKNVCLVRIGI